MRKLLVILLLTTSAFAQFQHKPILGEQVDKSHPLGDFVAAWFFLETTGTKVFDLSGNGYEGTINGATWSPGKFGPALSFNGSSNIITMGDVLDIPSNLTIMAWFNPATGLTNGDVIKKSNAYTFGLVSGTIKFEVNATGWSYTDRDTGFTPPANQWTHTALTFDGTNIRVYINGVLNTTKTEVGTISDTANNLFIGAGDYYFDGLIDLPMIYNRVLSASEIALLYREPFVMFEKDDIAILATAAVPPPAPTGQVITIIMTSIPLFLIPFFIIRRKYGK